MNKRKIRTVGSLACILAAVLLTTGMVNVLEAEEAYPARQSITHEWGSLTKSVSWEDQSHSNENYRAEITLNASDLNYEEFKAVDVALLISNSDNMFMPSCDSAGHQTLKADNSANVQSALDYLLGNIEVPDIEGLGSAQLKEKAVSEFMISTKIGDNEGYIMPIHIYSIEDGPDYITKYKERDNWCFVTASPTEPDDGHTLHVGKDGEFAAELRGFDASPGRLEWVSTGKAGMKAGCNSGSAIATKSAEAFVDTLLTNAPDSFVALIPYADKLNSNEAKFVADKEILFKQIEEAYAAPGGAVQTEAPFEEAKKVIEKDTGEAQKVAVFLTDSSIKNDNTRENAVKIAEGFRNQEIVTYIMGYGVTDTETINNYLKPFAFDYLEANPEGDCRYYIDTNNSDTGLEDGYKKIIGELMDNPLIFTDYISEYFEVDKENADSELIVEDVTVSGISEQKQVQKVTVAVPASKVKSKSAQVKIPIKLKEEYKDSKEFLNTNHIFPDSENKKAAKVEFASPEGISRSLEVDSVYLQPDAADPTPDITEAWLEFNLQGGRAPAGISFESVLLNVGTKISEASDYQATPIKPGYEFGGWYLEKECINPVGDTRMPDADKTIYAKWKPEEKKPEDEPKDETKEASKDKTEEMLGDFGNEMPEVLVVLGVSGLLAGGIWRWKKR